MRHRLLGWCFALVPCFVVFPVFLTAQQLEIHVINVGWGGSMFIKGPNGTTVLIEAGNSGKGTGEVVPYLQSIGIQPANGLDYTIVGHQHADHLGGMDEVVNAGYDVRVKNYYNGSSYSTTQVTQWNTAAGTTTAGALVSMPVGTEILLGNGAKITCVARNGSIIGGGSVPVSDENDRSIALLVQYGGFDFLWASDLGGGNIDESCTGRFTSSQTDVETSVITTISPGGASPKISSGGIDVLFSNHHGSESSTNKNWMNMSRPAVAVLSVGAGQSTGWDLPRKDVVENVLLAQATACITAPPALVLQTEEGAPMGSLTSTAGYCVGNIRISTDGVSTFAVSADGQVNQGPNELASSGLPITFNLDDVSGPPDTMPPVISNVQASNVTTSTATITWTTDENSNSVVEYGLTAGYGSTQSDPALVISHNVTLSGLTPGSLYHYRVSSTDAAGNTATSLDNTFTTASGPVTSEYSPKSMTISVGNLSSGSYTNLQFNEASYANVSASNVGGTRTTDWYATTQISEAPSSVTSLTVTYDGKHSRSNVTQKVYLFNYSTNAWNQIDSRTVGTSDVTITYSPATPTNYVSVTGLIRVRVLSTQSRNFTTNADYIHYTVQSGSGSVANPSDDHPISLAPRASEYMLEQNYPNPFNPSTTIRYYLPEQSDIRLSVFNTLGQEVALLVEGSEPAGYHTAVFSAGNLPSGVYFYKFVIPKQTMIRKLMLVK